MACASFDLFVVLIYLKSQQWNVLQSLFKWIFFLFFQANPIYDDYPVPVIFNAIDFESSIFPFPLAFPTSVVDSRDGKRLVPYLCVK